MLLLLSEVSSVKVQDQRSENTFHAFFWEDFLHERQLKGKNGRSVLSRDDAFIAFQHLNGFSRFVCTVLGVVVAWYRNMCRCL